MCALLEKHGFVMVRQKGSHQVMKKDLTGSSVTVRYDCLLLATNHAAYREIDFSGFKCPLGDTRNLPEAAMRPGTYLKA